MKQVPKRAVAHQAGPEAEPQTVQEGPRHLASQGSVRRAALDGVRILDLSRVLAGPWCTMALADLGADVIKVENPRGGDDTRNWGPVFSGGESSYYLCANRGKRSVTVDLASAEGQALVRELVVHCDVVVENFSTGALQRYGLDYESLREHRHDLIYCSISGYGRESPMAMRAGYDYVVQAEGGLMSTTGEPDGAPMRTGIAVADLFTGMYAVQAILAALIARDRDGYGQAIDLALFDCQLAMMANVASATLLSGQEQQRYGNAHASIVPYQLMPVRDGQIVLAVGNDRQFRILCEEILDRPDMARDPRFATNPARLANREACIALLSEVLSTRDAAHWLSRMSERGIPSGQVREVGAALRSPESMARGMVSEVQHPSIGPLQMVSSPIRMTGTPLRAPTAPPRLGEHTDEVIAQLRSARFSGN